MATSAMGHTLLPKVIALPVFSSDALSSVAYATQEILLVLGAAGAMALGRVVRHDFYMLVSLSSPIDKIFPQVSKRRSRTGLALLQGGL